MKKSKITLSLALTLLAGTAGLATAEEVGRATIGGREVIIDSNGTWRYADGAAAASGATASEGCAGYAFTSKKMPVSLCLNAPWRVDTAPGGAMEMQAHHTDYDLYVGVIVERIQMTEQTLRQAVIYNAASATGVTPKDVPILKEETATISGQQWKRMVYDVNFQGTPFRFGNYFSAPPSGGAMQLVFWSSPAFFDQNQQAIQDLLATVKVTP